MKILVLDFFFFFFFENVLDKLDTITLIIQTFKEIFHLTIPFVSMGFAEEINLRSCYGRKRSNARGT